eukprot:4406641-Alexandrium_andersonii.AAC.1
MRRPRHLRQAQPAGRAPAEGSLRAERGDRLAPAPVVAPDPDKIDVFGISILCGTAGASQGQDRPGG